MVHSLDLAMTVSMVGILMTVALANEDLVALSLVVVLLPPICRLMLLGGCAVSVVELCAVHGRSCRADARQAWLRDHGTRERTLRDEVRYDGRNVHCRVRAFDRRRWRPLLFEKYKDEVAQHMELTCPLMHGGVLSLERAYGSSVEKKVCKALTMRGSLDWLARNRVVMFFKANDDYLLRDGTDSVGEWNKVSTNGEAAVKLADALCGISSLTHFINSGEHRNFGRIADNFGADDCDFPKQGVMCPLSVLIPCDVHFPKQGTWALWARASRRARRWRTRR